jgi:hypothetical protein
MYNKISAILLCGGIGTSVWILPHLSHLSLWYAAIPLCIAAILGLSASDENHPADDRLAFLNGAGVMLAFAVALVYRFTYLSTVPIGTDIGETPFFTGLAANFATDGFKYNPYKGYMHTGYAYVGALGMLLSSEWDWGFRMATAVASALTVVTSFFAIRALTQNSTAAAWIGAGLLASSPWHMNISRVLMQKFLLTLCESITLLGLILAATASKSSRRLAGALLAVLGFVLGLNAYWGCYVLAATWGSFLLYLLAFHRSSVAQWGKPLLGASIIAFGLGLPVILKILPELGLSGYVKTKFDFGGDSFVLKVIRNLEFLFWALSSSKSRFGEPFVTAPTAFLFLVGLVRAAQQFRSSPGSALLLLNFAWFFIGIAVTWAHDMYMTGIIFSVYCLAGQGAIWIGQKLANNFGGGRAMLLGVVPLVLVGQQAFVNYTKALFTPIYARTPYVQPAADLRDEFRALTKTHSVWLPMKGLGETLLSRHNLKYPEYAFVPKVNTFDTHVPVFDTSKIQGSAGIELYLLPTPSTQILVQDTLKKLYPNLTITRLRPPPPHDRRPEYSNPTALRISIPIEDVTRLKEAPATTIGDTLRTQGFLAIPREGFYSFCHEEPAKPQLEINEQPFDLASCSDPDAGKRVVFLGTGLHRVVILGQRKAGELKILARMHGGSERPLRDLLWGFAASSAQEGANTKRGDSGKPTSFIYELTEVFPQAAQKVAQVSAFDNMTAVLASKNSIYAFERGSRAPKQVGSSIVELSALGRPGNPLLIAQRKPAMQVLSIRGEDTSVVFDSPNASILDFDQQGDRLALLREDGRVTLTKGGAVETTISVIPEKPATAVAWIADSIFVTTPHAIYSKNLSTGVSGRIAGDFSVLKNLSSDGEGNLYAWAPHQNETTRVFSSSGQRLLHTSGISTAIVLAKDGKPTRGLSLPKFLSDEIFAIDGNNLLILRKKAVP